MSAHRLSHLLRSGSAIASMVLLVGAATQGARAEETAPETASTAIDSESKATDPKTAAPGEDADVARPSGPPPPVGTRLTEALEGRRLRLGYSWERVRYQTQRTQTRDRSADFVRDVLGYTSTPRSLEVTIHTVEVAYAPHPRVTLVAEVPFVQKEFERLDFSRPGPCNGIRCQFQTEGIGDVRFAMIVPFIRKGPESSQIHIGLDAPTGSIRRQSGTGFRMPYLAQIGNGSVDFEFGWTYLGELERVSWGGQILGMLPLHRNGLKYQAGSRFTGRLWGAVRLFSGIDLSFRADWEKQNQIRGFDRSLRPTVDPSEDAGLYDRTTITLTPGFSLEVPRLAGQRIGIEVGIPVWQRLDGPQLSRRYTVKTAWRWIY